MKRLTYKKSAMSLLGYAIVFVILLGIGMIASAPFMFDKFENNSKQNYTQNRIEPERNYEQPMVNVMGEINRIERQLSDRISNLEQKRQNPSNKYVCTIEGKLDDNGIVVPISTSADISKKFVFVCEYTGE